MSAYWKIIFLISQPKQESYSLPTQLVDSQLRSTSVPPPLALASDISDYISYHLLVISGLDGSFLDDINP